MVLIFVGSVIIYVNLNDRIIYFACLFGQCWCEMCSLSNGLLHKKHMVFVIDDVWYMLLEIKEITHFPFFLFGPGPALEASCPHAVLPGVGGRESETQSDASS